MADIVVYREAFSSFGKSPLRRRTFLGNCNCNQHGLGWWDEFKSLFSSGSTGESASVMYDYLSKLFDQVMVCRRMLLKSMELGIASQSDISEFDKIVNDYDNIVRSVAKSYKDRGIAFGGEFVFLKTSTMSDFRTICCWTKKYSSASSTGLAGYSDEEWHVRGFSGITDDVPWQVIVGIVLLPIIPPAGILWLAGAGTVALFQSTSNNSVNFKNKQMKNIADALERKLANGDITPEEAFKYYTGTESDFNKTLEKLGLDKPKEKGFLQTINEILGKGTTLLIIGGVGVGGFLIYNAIKHRRGLVKIATAAAMKSPAPLLGFGLKKNDKPRLSVDHIRDMFFNEEISHAVAVDLLIKEFGLQKSVAEDIARKWIVKRAYRQLPRHKKPLR